MMPKKQTEKRIAENLTLTTILALLFYLNILDYITTSYAQLVGIQELNPFMRKLLAEDFNTFTQFKLLNASVIFLLTAALAFILESVLLKESSKSMRRVYEALVLLGTAVVGFYIGVIVNNLLQIFLAIQTNLYGFIYTKNNQTIIMG